MRIGLVVEVEVGVQMDGLFGDGILERGGWCGWAVGIWVSLRWRFREVGMVWCLAGGSEMVMVGLGSGCGGGMDGRGKGDWGMEGGGSEGFVVLWMDIMIRGKGKGW